MKNVLIVLLAVVCIGILNAGEKKEIKVKDMALLQQGGKAVKLTALSNIKNSKGAYCRIFMMKFDTAAVEGKVQKASVGFFVKRAKEEKYTLYVYAVKDSSPFPDWTGGENGSATWQSVTEKGLFTPKQDLYLANDPKLVLLKKVTVDKQVEGDIDQFIKVNGTNLNAFVNKNKEVTFVLAIDANLNAAVRSAKEAKNAPKLSVTTN